MSEIEYRPRLCHVAQGPNGYGFHLHGDKNKTGQNIRKVEADSPADHAGLKSGDRIVAVNGKNVENETHQQVVARIKERSGETELLVIDEAADKYFAMRQIPVTEELLNTENKYLATDISSITKVETDGDEDERRPRLCHLVRGDMGYGFNLHSEKGKEGRYVRAVDKGSVSEAAGLKAGDRIIEVNGVNMEYDKHAKLVEAIKASGDSVDLLVVGEKADAYFQSCKVIPTSQHISGSLPTVPVEESKPEPAEESAPEKTESQNGTVPSKQTNGSGTGELVDLDLQALKERVRISKKKAPTSNWNNRQAMFNNL